jgi:hypothetical protein
MQRLSNMLLLEMPGPAAMRDRAAEREPMPAAETTTMHGPARTTAAPAAMPARTPAAETITIDPAQTTIGPAATITTGLETTPAAAITIGPAAMNEMVRTLAPETTAAAAPMSDVRPPAELSLCEAEAAPAFVPMATSVR